MGKITVKLLHQLTRLAFYLQNIAKCKEKAKAIALESP
ncbi:bifunctional GMP synthase/glutamine amidotransferase protein [Crocosphaera chwakensis CCY0110]|uniref:Bifunctional GMP synthase/glutamine amidotransferase protein n=1 Tax=Crocosphaera chwakensis CCY0110 TaxID=391612 RepID=A3IXY7_9CHRO|nr:bifunctional GMP synthase/glutamine amidotransferase protein [Crocosphaera chwakensis CCY0110]